MDKERLLLVDDDEAFLGVLVKAMTKRGFKVDSASTIDATVRVIGDRIPDFAVIDLKLENESGLDLIPHLVDANPDIKIIVLTGFASIATAVEAIKRGASDYLSKPVTAGDIIKAFEGESPREEALDEFNPMSVERLEWEHIQKVLQENNGNISATARSLGMYRRTLQRKLAKGPGK
jgi:two-component system response regulator RegA